MFSCDSYFRWNKHSIYVLELCAVEAALVFGSMQQHSDTIINSSTNYTSVYVILPCVVGPCHHGMARPQVADRGTASNMEGSCE